MEERRGVLLLADPPVGGGCFSQMHIANLQTLIFKGNERLLSQAQEALHAVRMRWNWVCIAAEGDAAWIALALAAQLHVDRLALRLSTEKPRGRELNRLRSFAKRNLALVTGELLLLDSGEAMGRSLERSLGRGCALHRMDVHALHPQDLLDEWQR